MGAAVPGSKAQAQSLWSTDSAAPRHVDLPRPGIEPVSPALGGGSSPLSRPGAPADLCPVSWCSLTALRTPPDPRARREGPLPPCSPPWRAEAPGGQGGECGPPAQQGPAPRRVHAPSVPLTPGFRVALGSVTQLPAVNRGVCCFSLTETADKGKSFTVAN